VRYIKTHKEEYPELGYWVVQECMEYAKQYSIESDEYRASRESRETVSYEFDRWMRENDCDILLLPGDVYRKGYLEGFPHITLPVTQFSPRMEQIGHWYPGGPFFCLDGPGTMYVPFSAEKNGVLLTFSRPLRSSIRLVSLKNNDKALIKVSSEIEKVISTRQRVIIELKDFMWKDVFKDRTKGEALFTGASAVS
jgi:hypothetical protein